MFKPPSCLENRDHYSVQQVGPMRVFAEPADHLDSRLAVVVRFADVRHQVVEQRTPWSPLDADRLGQDVSGNAVGRRSPLPSPLPFPATMLEASGQFGSAFPPLQSSQPVRAESALVVDRGLRRIGTGPSVVVCPARLRVLSEPP